MPDDNMTAAVDPSLNPALNNGAFLNPAYATPNQRAALYAYANELMKPQPIKNGWQGLASIANALVGGYYGHQADVQEQASQAQNKRDYTNTVGAVASPASGGSMSGQGGNSPGPVADNSGDVANYVAQAASARGIDPRVATAVFNGESGLNPNTRPGDSGSSFNVPQLHYGNVAGGQLSHPGLGDAFTAATGLDARDPANWRKTVDFALDNAKTQGWQPWATTRDKLGLNNFSGIASNGQGGQPQAPAQAAAYMAHTSTGQPVQVDAQGNAIQSSPLAYAPQGGPGAAPAASAIAHAAPAQVASLNPSAGPAGGVPPANPPMAPPQQRMAMPQMAQNAPNGMPVSAQAIGELLGNSNVSPEMKKMAMELLGPKIVSDTLGNSYVSRQFQPPSQGQAPWFAAGSPLVNATLPGNIPATSYMTGTPNNPQVHTATPEGMINGAVGAQGIPNGNATSQTMDRLKNLAAGGQAISAQGNVFDQKAKDNAARFQKTTDTQWQLQQAAQPLLQIKNVMDQNGGQLPTGEGADKVLTTASVGNMLLTLLGHPITKEDSNLTGLELMRKYGTQVAMSLTGHNTDMGLQAAEHVSPGIGLSQAANSHLIDNYLRLNQLAQKRAQFERDYYNAHGGAGNPNAYDNFNNDWQAAITGPNAMPLSGEKYGRKVQVKEGDGSMGSRIVVPSTDAKGYSIYKPGQIPEMGAP